MKPHEVKPGLYILTAPEGPVSPRGVVKVIQDEREFPTIWIDEEKRWPIHALPSGCTLTPVNE